MKMLKWHHPDWSGWLATPPNWTQKDVLENYLSDGLEDPKTLELLTVEEVEMTQEEVDALPEFDG